MVLSMRRECHMENTPTPQHALHGLTVFERGWLSSNNILVHAAPEEAGATLIDSGHVNHSELTVQLLRQALAGQPLARLINTHLHSDHCGGNAAVQAAFGVPVCIPPGQADAVRVWDEERLSYRASGQRMACFSIEQTLQFGEPLHAGGRAWQVLAAPGHDPHSAMFFDAEWGVLISADALWQDGFGVVFPEVVGEAGFDDVAEVLEQIAALPVRVVIPGHGAPFYDVAPALDRARTRLAGFRADPARHLRYAAKVFIKYHLMEEREMAWPALLAWAAETPLMQAAWQGSAAVGSPGLHDWAQALVTEMAGRGALAVQGGRVLDR
jgi:glyoxylase-like metal-dependent hydrolase (beta-lactamase superfamily II)